MTGISSYMVFYVLMPNIPHNLEVQIHRNQACHEHDYNYDYDNDNYWADSKTDYGKVATYIYANFLIIKVK